MEIDMESKSNGIKRYLNKNIIVIIVTAACIYGLALWSICLLYTSDAADE